MRSSEQLSQLLRRLEGRGYRAYKDLLGTYRFASFQLSFDHVQGDPFATPSRLSVAVDQDRAGFPAEYLSSKIRRVALSDYLTRVFSRSITKICRGGRGTGHSGRFSIECGGQEVLERNSVLATAEQMEARFTVGLPAAGRRVLGLQAEAMLCDELPKLVDSVLLYRNLEADPLLEHIQVVEDQAALREQLASKGLVAFVGNDAVLPRRSGVDDRPLEETSPTPVIPFQSPAELEVEMVRPNGGPLLGMGIPEGVTLIVGGGFHGKSTLLRSVERGIYDHLPGDGRESVVTIDSAVKIRAEDGRYVEKVDISPFINHLPYRQETDQFSTENASGSTSQAANIVEALEMGTRLLLIDEDTSATNFIVRDARMQSLVAKPNEPITPFLDRVRELHRESGISTIMVMGGSGDYFDVADRVILLQHYRAVDVTDQARQIVGELPTRRQTEEGSRFDLSSTRYPRPESFNPRHGRKEVRIDCRGLHHIRFGNTNLDLTGLEQLIDSSQTRSIAWAILAFATRCTRNEYSLREGLEQLLETVEQEGLDSLIPYRTGNLARPRIFEIASAINRMRSLRIADQKQRGSAASTG